MAEFINDMLIENKRLDQESRNMRIMVFNHVVVLCVIIIIIIIIIIKNIITIIHVIYLQRCWSIEGVEVCREGPTSSSMKVSEPLIRSLQPIKLTKALSVLIQTMMHPIHNSRGVKIALE